MGCLLKTLEKGFIRLERDKTETKSEKEVNKKKSKLKPRQKSPLKKNIITIKKLKQNNNSNSNKIIQTHNNINNSMIKNKDNYFTKEQLEYYNKLYPLKINEEEELKIDLNFKK